MVQVTCYSILLALLEHHSLALPVRSSTHDLATRGASCTVHSMSDLARCKSSSSILISGLQVPGGQTLALENLKRGTTVTFAGKITFGFKTWEGPLVSMSGSGVTVNGNGVLDGQGALYWDGKGGNGGVKKPKFFYAHGLDESSITGITLLNTPVHAFSINANGLTVSGVTIDNSAGTGKGHNTDAFDIGNSAGITIKDCVVHNQDDCVAINSGTHIVISGMTCVGGHGISIGSVGGRSNNVVQGVSVSDCSISSSTNGLRIKTVAGATGKVSDITWTNIKLSGIKEYGVVIRQDYRNGGPSGQPTKGVPISNVKAVGITGTVSGEQEYVLCAACSNLDLSGVRLTGGKKGSVTGASI